MRNFKDITIVNVDGSGSGQNAVYAIEETLKQMPGARGLLISAEIPNYLPYPITWMPCNKMGYYEYSLFMIYCLHTYIHTDFALIVQDDGWALNGNNWNDEWYGYVYIGAPCHAALLKRDGVDYIVRNYEWENEPDALILQNGGLSLRSHRFLKAPSYHGIIYKLHNEPLLLNEDIQLGFLLRDQLEKSGLLFAPTETAKYFSVEYMGPKTHENLDLTKVFGHHSQNRRLRGPKTVHYQTSERDMERIYGEQDMADLLEKYGYDITFKE